MSSLSPTRAVLLSVYFALLGLLALSAWAAFLPLGSSFKLIFAIGIAALKTVLIFLVFMGLKYQRGLVRIFAVAGFFWLAVIGVLTFSDYLTRVAG